MRFRIVLAIVLFLLLPGLNAQGLLKKDKLVKVGLALGAVDFDQDFILGFSVSGEFVNNDDFGNGTLSLGFLAGTMSRRFNNIDSGIENIGTVRNQFFAARAAWYPNYFRGDRLQIYFALSLGIRNDFRVGTFAGILEDRDAFRIGHGYSVGTHYSLSEQVGTYLDLGFGLSNISIGAYFKLNRNYKVISSTVSR